MRWKNIRNEESPQGVGAWVRRLSGNNSEGTTPLWSPAAPEDIAAVRWQEILFSSSPSAVADSNTPDNPPPLPEASVQDCPNNALSGETMMETIGTVEGNLNKDRALAEIERNLQAVAPTATRLANAEAEARATEIRNLLANNNGGGTAVLEAPAAIETSTEFDRWGAAVVREPESTSPVPTVREMLSRESAPSHETIQRAAMTVGRLRRVSIREVWGEDAHSFARWLQGNLDVLNDALGRSTSSEGEAREGSIPVSPEADGMLRAIIECQLEESGNESLGNLMAAVASTDTRIAIWVVAQARPDHVQIVRWLNQTTSTRFYLLKADAVRINDSLPAPYLTLVSGPNRTGTAEVKRAA